LITSENDTVEDDPTCELSSACPSANILPTKGPSSTPISSNSEVMATVDCKWVSSSSDGAPIGIAASAQVDGRVGTWGGTVVGNGGGAGADNGGGTGVSTCGGTGMGTWGGTTVGTEGGPSDI